MKCRKIASLISAAALISGMITVPVSAATEFYVAETFDNYITNAIPDNGVYEGDDARVVETVGGKDKALYLKSYDSDASCTFKFGERTDSTAMRFDITSSPYVPQMEVTLFDKNDKEYKILTTVPGEDNTVAEIKTADGRKVGIIGRSKATIEIIYNPLQQRFSVYKNGFLCEYDWRTGNAGLSNVAGFKVTILGDGAAYAFVNIDNVYAYGADKPLRASELPKKAYLDETTAYTESTDETPETRVFICRTFDEENVGPFEGINYYQKTNRISIETEENGNKYMNINKTTDSDSHFEIGTAKAGRFVFAEMDVSSSMPKMDTWLFLTKDKANQLFNYMLRVTTGGALVTSGGVQVGTISKTGWTNVAIGCDFKKHTYDVYIDRELVMSGVPMGSQTIGYPILFRAAVVGGATEGNLKIDNYKVYSGKYFEDLNMDDYDQRKSIMPDNSAAIEALSGCIAINTKSFAYFKNGEKKKSDAIKITGGTTTLDKELAAELFGASAVGEEETYSVRELADKTGKILDWDSRGLIIIHNEATKVDSKLIDEINSYMLYDRPDAAAVLAAFKEKNAQHPYLLADKATFDGLKSKYEQDEYAHELGASVIKKANVLLGLGTAEYKVKDGQRLLSVSQATLWRILILGVAWYLTDDMKYADRAWAELDAVTSFPDWNQDSHYLDPSEMTAAVAIGYDWFYNVFTEEQRKQLSKAIISYSLVYTDRAYYGLRDAWWAKVNLNWNGVCNGGALIGAMAVMDENPELCSDIVANALHGFEYMMVSYAPEGAWFEGPGYWEYATRYLVMALSTLESGCGSDFNISKAQGFDNTGEYVLNMGGPVSGNNYYDGGAGGNGGSCVLFRLADMQNKPELARMTKLSVGAEGTGLTALGFLWYKPVSGDVNYGLDKVFKGPVEVASMRSSWTDRGATFLSFHGGKTAPTTHSHMDLGTFVLNMSGASFAEDYGSDDYNLEAYSSTNKHKYYRQRPEGHNTLVINPDESGGQALDAFANIEKLESKAAGAYSVLDLTSAYKDYASSLRRGYKLENDRLCAVIRDEIKLKGESTVYWFMQTKANIEVVDGHTAILERDGKRVRLEFITDAKSAEISDAPAAPLETSPVMPGQNANVGYRKVQIKLTGNGKVNLTVRISPEYMSLPEIEDTPIDEWTIPDGAAASVPRLDMLYVDGENMPGFADDLTSYEITMPYDRDSIPEITASSSQGEVTVKNAGSLDAPAEIEVRDNATGYTRLYFVKFKKMKKLEPVDGMTRYTPVAVTSSEFQSPEGLDTNAFDGDFSTRWAAEGDGQWLQADLGESKRIDKFGVTFMSQTARDAKYDLLVSDDAQNWTTVFSGQSERIEGYQMIELSESINARYVRLVAHKNTVNDWNSVTELAILANE